eukprot:RCo017524
MSKHTFVSSRSRTGANYSGEQVCDSPEFVRNGGLWAFAALIANLSMPCRVVLILAMRFQTLLPTLCVCVRARAPRCRCDFDSAEQKVRFSSILHLLSSPL